MVHADRLPAHEDPLKAHKADSGAEEFSRSLWRKEEGRKELEGKTVEGKERSVLEEWELEDPQHPVKSGLPHLAKPSLSEVSFSPGFWIGGERADESRRAGDCSRRSLP